MNCGCPSNTVTGRGAGSSLLKDPEHLHVVAKAIVQSVTIPVVTPSTIVDSYFNQVALNPLILPTGYSIYCSSQVASQLVNVAVQGGSY